MAGSSPMITSFGPPLAGTAGNAGYPVTAGWENRLVDAAGQSTSGWLVWTLGSIREQPITGRGRSPNPRGPLGSCGSLGFTEGFPFVLPALLQYGPPGSFLLFEHTCFQGLSM